MLGTFILGLAAGWAAPHAEPHVVGALKNVLKLDADPDPVEARSFALAACFAAAAIASVLLAKDAAVTLAIGTLVGVAVPRLMQMRKSAKTPDYDS